MMPGMNGFEVCDIVKNKLGMKDTLHHDAYCRWAGALNKQKGIGMLALMFL